MKKIIATSTDEIAILPIDCYSISHLNAGILAYFICYWVFIFFIEPLSAMFLSYLTATVGGLIWEFTENIFLIDTKPNKQVDSPINSLTDVALVFLGSVIGCILWDTDWIFKIILIGSLVLVYLIARILTKKNKNPTKMTKKNQLLNS